jgi:hypothetical protein
VTTRTFSKGFDVHVLSDLISSFIEVSLKKVINLLIQQQKFETWWLVKIEPEDACYSNRLSLGNKQRQYTREIPGCTHSRRSKAGHLSSHVEELHIISKAFKRGTSSLQLAHARRPMLGSHSQWSILTFRVLPFWLNPRITFHTGPFSINCPVPHVLAVYQRMCGTRRIMSPRLPLFYDRCIEWDELTTDTPIRDIVS